MIKLQSGNYQAGVRTDGACLLYWRRGETDLLRPTDTNTDTNSEDPLDTSCYPCVPYFGRIAGSILNHPLAITHSGADDQHAIHGEGWLSNWAIRDHSDHSLNLHLESHEPKPGQYPFPWAAALTVRLENETLSITLSVTNRSDQTAPFGLGLHPFLPRMSDTNIQFTADRLVTPPGMSPIDLQGSSFHENATLPEFLIDHSFQDWAGQATLKSHQSNMKLALTSDAPHLHIYAPVEGSTAKRFICLEPITHLPGVMGNDILDPSVWLEPGELQSITMSIKDLSLTE